MHSFFSKHFPPSLKNKYITVGILLIFYIAYISYRITEVANLFYNKILSNFISFHEPKYDCNDMSATNMEF